MTLDEVAFVGDDVIDLPVMRQCGLAIATGNAREQVKAEAHYVTPHRAARARDATRSNLSSKPRECWSNASRPPLTKAIHFRRQLTLAKAGI